MGRHINARGEFQSDKYPDLPPDRIVLSFRDVRAWPSLMVLARRYEPVDPELAQDIRTRLQTIELVGKP